MEIDAESSSSNTISSSSENFVKIRPSLVTTVGMVNNGGLPQHRYYNNHISYHPQIKYYHQDVTGPSQIISKAMETCSTRLKGLGGHIADHGGGITDINEKDAIEICVNHVIESCVPEGYLSTKASSFARNLIAMLEPNVNLDKIKGYIRGVKRLDMEQAVGLVIALVKNKCSDDAKLRTLIEAASECILGSCMWLEPKDITFDGMTRWEQKFSKFLHIFGLALGNWLRKYNLDATTGIPRTPADVICVLDKLRRKRHPEDKVLNPVWLTERVNADSELTLEVKDFWDKQEPLLLPNRHINRIERWLRRGEIPNDPVKHLRHEILNLKESNFSGTGLESESPVLVSEDIFAVSYSFITLQRRLQKKVVSDLNWTRFLDKGQCSSIFQNDINPFTSFEKHLVDFCLESSNPDVAALCCIRRPTFCLNLPRLTITNEVEDDDGFVNIMNEKEAALVGMDRTSLLMEKWVDVHGKGDFENLVLRMDKKVDRGPVDEYNLLVDLLNRFRTSYKAEIGDNNLDKTVVIPGHCHKFLAADIMYWNNSFGDDAFSNGKRPGWIEYLASRRTSMKIPQKVPILESSSR